MPPLSAFRLVLTWLALALSMVPACAVSVTAEITPLAARARSSAPCFVTVTLRMAGAPLVEGRLELSLSRGGGRPIVVQSHDLAVSPSGLTLRMLVPHVPGNGEVTVDAQLLSSQGTLPAGQTTLWAMPDRQTFTLAVIGGKQAGRESEPRLWHELSLERFASEPLNKFSSWAVAPAFLDPADLPEFALALCGFDVVLLEGASFSRLRPRQLDALIQWVEAGGSVCLARVDGVLNTEHLSALRRLLPLRELQHNARGRLIPPPEPIIRSRAELGRCLLAMTPPADVTGYRSAEWREASAFLWSISASRIEQMRNGEYRIGSGMGSGDRYGALEHSITAVLESLLPDTFRMLPLGVIVALLAGFLLVVGPGEWFVLGWLHLRRWTWLTFPLTAGVFCAATMLIANHYLGRNDQHVTLRITDIGRAGRPLRESAIRD